MSATAPAQPIRVSQAPAKPLDIDALFLKLSSEYRYFRMEREQGFARICPDFVAELRSPTDRLEAVREKMREYPGHGCRLGWLIDPEHRRVEVYRPGQPAEILEGPEEVSGEPVLPGFVLRLKGILFI